MSHHGSLGHFQVSVCHLNISRHMHSLLPISAYSNLGQGKWWQSNPTFTAAVQGLFSAPRQANKLTISLEAGFQVATRTTLPLSSVTGCLTGKQITHIHPAPSKQHISHIHFSLLFHYILTFPSQLILFH